MKSLLLFMNEMPTLNDKLQLSNDSNIFDSVFHETFISSVPIWIRWIEAALLVIFNEMISSTRDLFDDRTSISKRTPLNLHEWKFTGCAKKVSRELCYFTLLTICCFQDCLTYLKISQRFESTEIKADRSKLFFWQRACTSTELSCSFEFDRGSQALPGHSVLSHYRERLFRLCRLSAFKMLEYAFSVLD